MALKNIVADSTEIVFTAELVNGLASVSSADIFKLSHGNIAGFGLIIDSITGTTPHLKITKEYQIDNIGETIWYKYLHNLQEDTLFDDLQTVAAGSEIMVPFPTPGYSKLKFKVTGIGANGVDTRITMRIIGMAANQYIPVMPDHRLLDGWNIKTILMGFAPGVVWNVNLQSIAAALLTLAGNFKVSVEEIAATYLSGSNIKTSLQEIAATYLSGSNIKTSLQEIAATYLFNSDNYLKTLRNNQLSPMWLSPSFGTATYSAPTVLTLAAFPATIKAINHIITSITVENVAHVRTTYENGKNGISIYINADNQVTILGAGATPFLNTDVQYEVGIRAIDLAYDLGTNLYRIKEQSPLNLEVIPDVIIDTTNVAAGTNYYPSSDGLAMLGYKGISIQGAQVDDCLVTVEVTNDQSAIKVWHDITPSLWDRITNSVGSAGFGGLGVTTTFFVDEDINADYIRLKIVTYDATNIEEIYTRRRAL